MGGHQASLQQLLNRMPSSKTVTNIEKTKG